MLLAVLAATLPAAWADEPPTTAPPKLCAVLNNRILGPRSADRPLPLLQGKPPALRAACAATWSTLSPGNHALEVTDCYQNNLLQVANQAACGTGTGPLWVSSRWVVTSGELEQSTADSPICQKLETGAWAGTRDFKVGCKPQPRDFEVAPPERTNPAPPARSQPSASSPERTAPASDSTQPAPETTPRK
jgi:hypothetical protein